MARQIIDFQDIYEAVMEELKYQASDTVSLERIKRDINMGYVQEVVPYKRWSWLTDSVSIVHKAFWPIGAITVSVTPDDATVTFSTAPDVSLGSFKGFKFAVDGFDEVYTIDSHTAGATTAELTTTYQGSLAATAAFKVWRDKLDLPTDCRETVEVGHDRNGGQLDPLGFQEMRRRRAHTKRVIGFPQYYTTHTYYDPSPLDGESETDRYRQMLLHPSLTRENITLHIDYIKEVAALDDDADEPLIPREDRMVLVYYALARAWGRERNPEMAQYNMGLFQRKLDRMAGEVEDGIDTPQVSPTSHYLRAMRGPRLALGKKGAFVEGTSGGGGGGNSNINFLKNVTIEGATITDNVTVTGTNTIDGRDLSVDGANLDAHIAASSNVHGVTGSVVGTTDTQTLTNKTISAASNTVEDIGNSSISSSAAIDRTKLASGTANHVLINDASGVISSEARLDLSRFADGTANHVLIAQGASSDSQYGLLANANIDASAAIEFSKMENLTADRVLVSDSNGDVSASSRASSEIDYLENAGGWQSVSLTDNTSNGTVASWADTIDAVWLNFALTRGSTVETGVLFIASDGTNASVVTMGAAQGGSNGVTFDAIVSGGNLTLRYTTTSTGSGATLNYNEMTRTVS